MGLQPPRPRGGSGAGGGGSCRRRIPQIATDCLFFLFFFLKNSSHSSLSLQTSTWPLTQPNSPSRPGTDWVRGRHCPTLPTWHPHTAPVCLPLRPYSPPATSSIQVPVVLLKPCLAGEGAVDLALSQESCSRPGGHWTWGCSHPAPHTGPRDLIVLKHSPYRLIFQCLIQFLVSNLHICWDIVGCSLCS